ncbi:sensor histidine kinase [Effusibacillus lacus]|uniref:histidine kinase n=1 Tax=Effusibacillus lacus TaxID=1348429 RepID=A0A292YJV7_9BACL|nr:ATP-binding protein [Effusibacillus lacus]TCS72316.1 signal transduction histidine kinase [Effusibacillus lacus]GAX90218.1 two-component sensor histidine kinase [Effusibacillus lacus]
MRSLQKKLAFILTGLAVAAVLLSTWILTAFDRYHFQQYVSQNKQLRNERIVQTLAHAYEKSGGWKKDTGAQVGEYLSREGVGIRLLDSNGSTVWQYERLNPPQDAQLEDTRHTKHLENQMASTDRIEIQSHGQTIGFAEVTYIDPESYTALDYHYWQGMTQGVVSAILPVIVLSLAVSWLLSRRITQPLTDMIGLARKMREGQLNVRVRPEKGGDELAQLAQSLNHLAEELQKQDKLRRNLTADVAHELRTPLTTLKSHIEAMTEGVWEPTPERLQGCQEEVERLIGLVTSLQSLSQAESDSLVMNLREEDVTDATRQVLNIMEAAFAAKGVRQEFDGESAVLALIDRDKWKQILMNLLENALKHTEPGGKVRVSVGMQRVPGGGGGLHGSNHNVLVTVADTGKGIEAEHVPYIFERFYRADPSRTRTTGGAGIGLTIVKKLVEAHGGTIEVKSEPGAGTEFRIRLPGA